MNENQDIENIQPAQTDDVEGHGVTSGRFRPDDSAMFGNDVGGRGISSGRLIGQDDEVEGHGISSGRIDGPDDDVEGHAGRIKV